MHIPRKIYAIKHNTTGRIYIGSSRDVESRIKNHICQLRIGKHNVADMQADFNEYGENFSFFVLDEIECYEDRVKEYEWMRKLETNVRGKGYNYKDMVFTKESKYYVTYNGESMNLSQLSKRTGVPYETLYGRIITHGWSAEEAVKPHQKLKASTIEFINLINDSNDPEAAIRIASKLMQEFAATPQHA
jgi:group I intron endonuclease